jgi:hypothetical protein
MKAKEKKYGLWITGGRRRGKKIRAQRSDGKKETDETFLNSKCNVGGVIRPFNKYHYMRDLFEPKINLETHLNQHTII